MDNLPRILIKLYRKNPSWFIVYVTVAVVIAGWLLSVFVTPAGGLLAILLFAAFAFADGAVMVFMLRTRSLYTGNGQKIFIVQTILALMQHALTIGAAALALSAATADAMAHEVLILTVAFGFSILVSASRPIIEREILKN